MSLLFQFIFICFTGFLVTTNLNANTAQLKQKLTDLSASMNQLKTKLETFSSELFNIKNNLEKTLAYQWNSEDSFVIKKLQDGNLISGNITEKKAIPQQSAGNVSSKAGSNCDRILFVTTNQNKSYVVKEKFDETYGGDIEKDLTLKEKVTAWNSILNTYAQKNKPIMVPKLVQYWGGIKLTNTPHPNKKITAVVMSKAEGEDLDDILQKLDSFSEADAEEMGSAIGTQMGAKTKAFFQPHKAAPDGFDQKSFLAHNDINLGNLFYNHATKQLSFIDLSRTRETEYKEDTFSPKDHYKDYFDSERIEIEGIWSLFFPSAEKNQLEILKTKIDNGEQIKDVFKKSKIGIIVAQAFYNSYYNEVKDLDPAKYYLEKKKKEKLKYIAPQDVDLVKELSILECSFIWIINEKINGSIRYSTYDNKINRNPYEGYKDQIKKVFTDLAQQTEVLDYLFPSTKK